MGGIRWFHAAGGCPHTGKSGDGEKRARIPSMAERKGDIVNMSEQEILLRISNIVNGFVTFAQAVVRIRLLLEHAAGAKALIIKIPGRSVSAQGPANLLDSLDQAYRSLYTVDLRLGSKILGSATLCFATDRCQGALPERLANFVGEQLGMLLGRTRLAERQKDLKGEIERIEIDLATRKLRQRAEGILVDRCGVSPALTKRWFALESSKTGLSETAIATRLIATYQPALLDSDEETVARRQLIHRDSVLFSDRRFRGPRGPLTVLKTQSVRRYPPLLAGSSKENIRCEIRY
jgi:hypothetical protein